MGLEDKVKQIFLTDCGTSFSDVSCLAKLIYELWSRKTLVGVTAGQGIETINPYFLACKSWSCKWMRGEYAAICKYF